MEERALERRLQSVRDQAKLIEGLPLLKPTEGYRLCLEEDP